jgi:hypothetical protein
MSIWDEAPKGTEETFKVLQEFAKYMSTITYEGLGERVGLPAIGTNKPLGFIRDRICRPDGLPWLNALAVSKANRVPGESFIPESAQSATKDPNNELLWWRGMVLQVYAYPWHTLHLP